MEWKAVETVFTVWSFVVLCTLWSFVVMSINNEVEISVVSVNISLSFMDAVVLLYVDCSLLP